MLCNHKTSGQTTASEALTKPGQTGIDLARLGFLAAISIIIALLVLQAFHALKMVMGADENWIMPNGVAIGSDFIAIWSAGHLAALGEAGQAYNDTALFAAHQTAVLAGDKTFPWFYPPVFQLLAMPLGMLPYLVAFPVYSLSLAGLYLWVLWKLRPKAQTLLMGVTFHGLWLSLMAGQNGTLTAALLGAGLLPLIRASQKTACIDTDQAAGADMNTAARKAGLAWGVICYKPQLAVPLAVAALVSKTGRKTILPALAMIAFLSGVSLLILGPEVWAEFFATSGRLTDILARGALPMDHMISVYAAFWRAGVDPLWALMAQGATALLCAAIVAQVWKEKSQHNISGGCSYYLKGAVLVWAILLTTPHLFQYELPIAGLGLLLMWCEAERTSWLRAEKAWLFFVWVSPIVLSFALLPAVFMATMALCWHRAKSTKSCSS